MAVKIRLKRMGKIRAPYYRIVVADSRTKRDGRVIEEIGKYHPKEDPSFIEVDSNRALYWLGVGAQPSEPVTAILKVTGDWQKFKGEAAPAPMKVAEPKRDKTDIFNEALKDSQGEPKTEAVTARRTAAKKAAATDESRAVEAVAEEGAVAQMSPVADPAAADAAMADEAPAGADTDPVVRDASVPADAAVPDVDVPADAETDTDPAVSDVDATDVATAADVSKADVAAAAGVDQTDVASLAATTSDDSAANDDSSAGDDSPSGDRSGA